MKHNEQQEAISCYGGSFQSFRFKGESQCVKFAVPAPSFACSTAKRCNYWQDSVYQLSVSAFLFWETGVDF